MQRSMLECLMKMPKQFSESVLYQMQMKHLQKEIKKQEQMIAQLQENYLQKTKYCGNIVKGFQDYVLQKTLLVQKKDELVIQPKHKIFSLSSVTSQVSKEYKQTYCKMKKALRQTRFNSKSMKNLNKHQKQKLEKMQQNQKKDSQLQEPQQDIDSYDELSIQSAYVREGSLEKRPQRFETPSKPKSQDNLSDTLSDRSPINSETQSIESITTQTKSIMKKPQKGRQLRKWLNKQKKRIQVLREGDQQFQVQQQIDYDRIQGIHTLGQLRGLKKKSIKAKNGVQTSQKSQDSCENVKQSLKMAGKTKS